LPRAVLFDWDGTLVDNWHVIQDALNHALVAMGHDPWSMAETMDRVSRSQRDSFPAIFGARWQEARDKFYARFEELHLDALRILPGAEEILTTLAGTDIPLAVVSNKRGDFLRREAAHLGWETYFTKIVGATDADEDKPSAAPIRLILDACSVEPGPEVWLVGDTATDVQCAANAGCTSILVGQNTIGDENSPDWRFDGLAELAKLVAAV
jgi:phosphoglycolate phosphatase